MDSLNTMNFKEIIDIVNAYYEHSYQSLLWIMGVIITATLALVGLLVPYLQRRQNEREIKSLKDT